LASSLGRLAKTSPNHFDSQEILRSLIMAIAINTGQLAGLLTKKHGISHVLIEKNSLNSLAFNKYFFVIMNLNLDDSQIQQSKCNTLSPKGPLTNFCVIFIQNGLSNFLRDQVNQLHFF
jgi:hypothetical protein